VASFNLDDLLGRVHGDETLLLELIGILKSEAPRLLDEISRAIDAKDAKALERAAHRLRGSVASFGAADATNETKTLESMGRSGNLDAAPSHFARLSDEVARLLVDLEQAAIDPGVGARA
jgi:HPt (histidine-containing phosphotransfer) domain-containing protein